jgi:hypothetical protein
MQREGLYQALRQAFAKAGIPWRRCHHEDRGDGAFVLARPGIPKDLFAGSLPGELVTALRQHNEARPAQEQIRLRMAIHAGEVIFDDHGATSAAVNLAFRLLDAAPLKAALAVIRPPLPSATPRSAQPIAPLSCGETIVPDRAGQVGRGVLVGAAVACEQPPLVVQRADRDCVHLPDDVGLGAGSRAGCHGSRRCSPMPRVLFPAVPGGRARAALRGRWRRSARRAATERCAARSGVRAGR